ncbi:peptidoglycan-binding domain-containing protein [Promicromonospora sukumoe]
MMKRLFAVVVALVLGTGASVLTAAPASATAGTCAALYTTIFSVKAGSTVVYKVELPVDADFSRFCTMWNGSPNRWVAGAERLQISLNRCYGENLATDGYFGRATELALMRAQAEEGLDDDGIYGTQTQNYLKWAKTTSGCGRIWV